MKRILSIIAFLTFAGTLFAQNNDIGWPQRQDKEKITVDPNGQDITIDRNTFIWQPFNDTIGYSIYGSRYRKAKTNRNWGSFLCEIVAPISALVALGGMENDTPGSTIVGVAGLAASLGAGIPLWRKGRRELDRMLDDYARRYAPRPYSSSISAGPTPHGIGLALNF